MLKKEGKKMQAVRTRRKKRISCDGNGMCGCVHPVLKCARGQTPLQRGLTPIGQAVRIFRIDQQPHPLLPNPPQQKSRRMIHRQLSFPHPLPLNVLPPHPPQQQSRRMIHRQEDIPFPLSHPHPQFVAVNSLMLNPPIRLFFTVL